MEMQKTLGGLTQAVTTLTNHLQGHDDKIDRLESNLNRIEKIIYAATVLVTVLGGIAIFFANKVADLLVRVLSNTH
jgi:tyrosine-protein phosphatase YwqE